MTITSQSISKMILAGCFLAVSAIPCFPSSEAVKEKGDPTDYTVVPSLAVLEKTTNDLHALVADGGLSVGAILQSNVHGASVVELDSPASRPGPPNLPGHPDQPRVPLPPFQAQGYGINQVKSLGVMNGMQELEVDGSFSENDNDYGLGMNCGTGLIYGPPGPDPTTTISASSTQMIIGIQPNVRGRACTISSLPTTGIRSDLGLFSFQLPGVTCTDWQPLCPSQTVGVFQATASDGSKISIDIRNGSGPGDQLTAADIAGIESALSQIPPNDLKNIHYIQYNSELHFYISGSDAGPDGGVYIGDLDDSVYLGTYRDQGLYNFPVNYGVADNLYLHLPADELAFWKTHYENWEAEKSYAIHYLDWIKGTWDIVQTAIDSFVGAPSGVTTSDIQQGLVMTTHFYDPKTGEITSGNETGYQVLFTKTEIQINDVIFYLNGDNIVAMSRAGVSKTFYSQPIPIPKLFLERIPQTS